MKIIIAGSRGFSDFDLLKRYIDSFIFSTHDPDIASLHAIVSGTAPGADRLGEKYAKQRGFLCHKRPADWDKYGKSAGLIRNAHMANYADIAIVFWDGKSKGSKHMIITMRALNKPCFVVLYDLK